MDRISRFFGRKTEPSDTSDQGKVQPTEIGETEEMAFTQNQGKEGFGLKFIDETGNERVFTALPIKIGRADENDLVLKDETVSSSHALVYYDENARAICILDRDSLNGITIEGFPTRKNLLLDGARIGLGAVSLTFRDTGYLHQGQHSG